MSSSSSRSRLLWLPAFGRGFFSGGCRCRKSQIGGSGAALRGLGTRLCRTMRVLRRVCVLVLVHFHRWSGGAGRPASWTGAGTHTDSLMLHPPHWFSSAECQDGTEEGLGFYPWPSWGGEGSSWGCGCRLSAPPPPLLRVTPPQSSLAPWPCLPREWSAAWSLSHRCIPASPSPLLSAALIAPHPPPVLFP